MQQRDRRVLTCRDAQFAGRFVAELAEQRQLAIDFFKPRRDHPQQMLAGFGGGETLRVVRASNLTPSRSSS